MELFRNLFEGYPNLWGADTKGTPFLTAASMTFLILVACALEKLPRIASKFWTNK